MANAMPLSESDAEYHSNIVAFGVSQVRTPYQTALQNVMTRLQCISMISVVLLSSAFVSQPGTCQAAATDTPESPYAGAEVCQLCHEDIAKAFSSTPHALLNTDKKRGWEGKGCESCHRSRDKSMRSPPPRKTFATLWGNWPQRLPTSCVLSAT